MSTLPSARASGRHRRPRARAGVRRAGLHVSAAAAAEADDAAEAEEAGEAEEVAGEAMEGAEAAGAEAGDEAAAEAEAAAAAEAAGSGQPGFVPYQREGGLPTEGMAGSDEEQGVMFKVEVPLDWFEGIDLKQLEAVDSDSADFLGIDRGNYFHGQRENAVTGPPFRQPRPPLPVIRNPKDRQVPSIRNDPALAKAPMLIDVLEHEAYLNRFRDEESGGGFMDMEIAEFDEQCDEDAFYNEFVSEDDYFYPSDWEDPPHISDRVRQHMYYLWAYKHMNIPDIASRFGIRTERVSGIIALKHTEPAAVRQGMYSPRLEAAVTKFHGEGLPIADHLLRPDHDLGVNVDLLRDTQLPDDVVPKMAWRGNALRLGAVPDEAELPPTDERRFRHRFAFKNISGGDRGLDAVRTHFLVVDFDGTRRGATRMEDFRRSGRPRRYLVDRRRTGATGLPFAEDDANTPYTREREEA